MTNEDYKNIAACIALGIRENAGNDQMVLALVDLKKRVFDALQTIKTPEDGKGT